MSTDTLTAAGRRVRTRRAVWLTTMAIAVAAPVLIWVLTVAVAGHSLVAVAGGSEVTVVLPSVIAGGVVATAAGLGFMTLLQRWTAAHRRVYAIVAGLALLLSLVTPMGGTTTATVLVLASMHVVVGATVVLGGLLLPARASAA